jgi:hypothetical protein
MVDVVAQNLSTAVASSRVRAGMMAAALFFTSMGNSQAEPPPPLWIGKFGNPIIVCDTKDQAVAIAKAGQESSEAMLAKFREFVTTTNDKGESTCANSEAPYLMVGEHEDFGLAHSGSDDLMHIWVVHGSTLQEGFWFIYADVPNETNS